MRRAFWKIFIAVILISSCSGGRIIEPEPVVQPETEPEIDPRLVSNDPFDRRLKQFEDTYTLLVCRANMNYDAMASMGMVIEPWNQMHKYAEEKSTSLDPYLDILRRNGYENLESFEAARTTIDEARRGWWDGLTGSLFDILEGCNKPAP